MRIHHRFWQDLNFEEICSSPRYAFPLRKGAKRVISFLEIANGLFSVLGVATLYTLICWGVGAGFSEKASLAPEIRIPRTFVIGTVLLSWLFGFNVRHKPLLIIEKH
jgi:hypothetical protein